MRRISLFLIVFSIVLSACASQPAATTPPAQAPTGQETEPTPTTAQPTQAEQSTEMEKQSVTFQIVPGESQVTYEVGETFFNQGNVFNLAVGVTTQVSGDVVVDYSNPQNSTIGPVTVDISQFTSDSNRRDNAIRDRFLESSQYPIATFTPTKIEGLPTSGEEGVDYPVTITGDLQVKETTKEVTFDAVLRLEGDTLTGTATTTILLSEFGVGPISIAGILETQDEAKITISFVARPAQ